jgi:RNA methyltransferase, TrmH family
MQRKIVCASAVQKTLNHIKLLAQRRNRDREKRLWIEGIRNFVQAFDAKIEFETVVISPILLQSDLADMLARRLTGRGVRTVRVTPEEFRAVSSTERASGIGAIIRQPWTRLEDVDPRRGNSWLILEEIRSAGNLGTILRTAEACGAGGVIFLGPSCDPFDPVAVRAAMGGLFHLCLVKSSHDRVRAWAAEHGIRLIGLSPEAERLWTDLPPGSGHGFVIGEERKGLSDRSRVMCDAMVRLPMSGWADSINVGVAAGVMLYEVVRRGEQTS